MTTLVRAELLKLRTTRVTKGVVLLTAALLALVTLAGNAAAGEEGRAVVGSAANVADVLRGSNLPVVLVLLLALLGTAGEYHHATVTPTFLVTPRRGRVIAAKLIAYTGVGLLIGVAGIAVTLLVSAPAFAGADTVALFDGEVVRTAAGAVAACAVVGALGVAVGMLLRNPTAAVVGALGWITLGEGIIGVVAGDGAARWLPGGVVRAVSGVADGLLPAAAAVPLAAAYAAAVSAAAWWLVVQEDVT